MDPPYLQGGVRTGSKGGGKYLYEFAEKDHKLLAQILNRFNHARVVVSYYEDERLEKLYPLDSWVKRKVYFKKNLQNANGRNGKCVEAPEVLLLNGVSLSEEPGLFKAGCKNQKIRR